MVNEGVDWALSFGDGADVDDDGPDVNAQAPGPASRGGAGGANEKAPQEPKTVRPRIPPGRSRDAGARFRACPVPRRVPTPPPHPSPASTVGPNFSPEQISRSRLFPRREGVQPENSDT